MKKLLVTLLCVVLAVVMLASCGGKNDGGTTQTGGNATQTSDNAGKESDGNTKTLAVEDVEIEVLSCSFEKEVMGLDEETSTWGFTERDGKVYVNMAMKIKNNSDKPVSEDDVKAYFEYDGLRCDMKYEVVKIVPKSDKDDNILPGCLGLVNMIYIVDEEAVSSDLVVKLTVLDKEFEEKVAPIDTRDAFSKKTEVTVGEKINVDGLYEVEVVKCEEMNYLKASNYEESAQYEPLGEEKFVDLVLKVKNNTDVDLAEIDAYTFVNDEGLRAADKIEVKDNTDINYLSAEPLKAGQEEYIHLFVSVEKDFNTADLAMRFNLGTNCYYCKVK